MYSLAEVDYSIMHGVSHLKSVPNFWLQLRSGSSFVNSQKPKIVVMSSSSI